MKKHLLLFIAFICIIPLHGQKLTSKTNLIYGSTLTLNLIMEVGLTEKLTLDIATGYNPWKFKDNKRFQHWLVQPELRYWLCEQFNGLFFGVHIHGAGFNVANVKFPYFSFRSLKDKRFEGWLTGGGVSIGYQWILGKRWNLEAALGAGYAYMDYAKYGSEDNSALLGRGSYNYWGITRANLSFVYFIF